jgi:tetratricopeptide (TPR) repeat protein
MKKLNLLLVILSAFNFCFGQKEADSIRQALNSATDTKKVELLLSINQVNFAWKGKEMVDSTYYYAKAAYDLSDKIGFIKGKGYAAKRLSEWAHMWSKDCALSLQYAKEAVNIAEQVKSDTLLAQAYFRLAGAVQCEDKEKNFEEAIDALKKAAAACKRAGDRQAEGTAYWEICSMLSGKGNYNDGFNYCQSALELTKASADEAIAQRPDEAVWAHQLVEMSLLNMANLYVAAGDFQTAEDYVKQNKDYQLTHTPCCPMDDAEVALFIKMNQPDSALNTLEKLPANAKQKFFYKNYKAQALLLKREYKESIKLLTEALPEVKKDNKFHSYSKLLIDLGTAYNGIGDYKSALKYVSDGVKEADLFNIHPYRLEGYKALSSINYSLKNYKSAFQYLQYYTQLKDSVINNQFYWRLNNYKKAAEDQKKIGQIGILSRNNKIKEQQLKQEGLIKSFLVAGLILFSLIGLFIFRTLILKRRNERFKREKVEDEMKLQQLQNQRNQAELQRKAADLEMQALRAQMNPHFIFNCLSSINRFILKNESKAASSYLTRFSRLIRMVLMNSQKNLITLEDELQMLRLYLDMERLRFKDSFSYRISFLNTIEADTIFIPPLLLQPFCENAIWHGLMHKENEGFLDITLSVESDILSCSISDDGIGRQKAEEIKTRSAEKEKSMGLKITTERLALLNREKGVHTFYEIEDLFDNNGMSVGTKVNLKIGYKDFVEETLIHD